MIRKFAFALLLATAVPAAARAEAFQALGPHLGFSSGPDQVILGGQLLMGDVAPQVDLLPGMDIGFGDDMTLVTLNGDFHYRIKLSGASWQPYAGGGVAFTFGEGESAAGGTIIGGADIPTKSGSKFFVEAKIGLGDAPDFKVLAGWHFKM